MTSKKYFEEKYKSMHELKWTHRFRLGLIGAGGQQAIYKCLFLRGVSVWCKFFTKHYRSNDVTLLML